MNKFELKTKIEQELKEFSENFIVNIVIDQHIFSQALPVILEYLMKKLQLQGLYISLNKPYETIREELTSINLDANAIYCIDFVSKKTGKFLDSDKCFCLDDPSALTELSLMINTLSDEKKINFIVLDSLSTLLLYNDEKTVEKFVHEFLNKARKSNISVVITSPKEKNEEDALAIVTQFCDKEIEL